jgi:hypothetical protein
MSTDTSITCRDCGQAFTFTSGEQDFYASRGFSEPSRCAVCRAARKNQRDAGGSSSGSYGSSSSYDRGERAPRDTLLGGAEALLHLIGFEEPFGLSTIEAMATGTPVIAFQRGSMSELIEDGVSGFLIAPNDVDGAASAVCRIRELDRRIVRAHVERHFSADRMVDDYMRLYRSILGHAPNGNSPETAEPIQGRKPRPIGARCDGCHERRPRVQRTQDGLLTICNRCARGVEVKTSDATAAIAALAARAPAVDRRALARRLAARVTIHQTRQDRATRRVP